MRVLKRLLFAFLMLSAVFSTGCDADKIMEKINKVVQGIQKAIPAVKEAVKTVTENKTTTNTTTTTTATATTPATASATATPTETNQTNNAGVVVVDPEQEEITTFGTNNQGIAPEEVADSVENTIVVGKDVTPISEVGTVNNSAEAMAIKQKYNVTLVDGKNWDGEWEYATSGQWNSEKTKILEETLGKLPQGFLGNAKSFALQDRVYDAEDGSELLGIGGEPIILSNNDDDFAGTVVHELTHRFQGSNPDAMRLWAQTFWPNGVLKSSSASDYGNTNPAEDMAESVRVFFQDPEKLKASDPERYEFVKNYIWK